VTPLIAADLLQRCLTVVLTVGGPLLLAALVVGVLVSLMQVQEQSLTFIPKLLVVAVVFIATLPWMLRAMVEFTVGMFQTLPQAAR
jgi:flagellar biosynthetic protein FliQ